MRVSFTPRETRVTPVLPAGNRVASRSRLAVVAHGSDFFDPLLLFRGTSHPSVLQGRCYLSFCCFELVFLAPFNVQFSNGSSRGPAYSRLVAWLTGAQLPEKDVDFFSA